MKKKVLIGSPIHQKPAILNYFLSSLSRLNIDNIELHYVFIDDNEIKESSNLLRAFSEEEKNVNIIESGRNDSYIRDNQTHHWNSSLVWKVAGFKDIIIQIADENECDYLFLIDSDLVLHPHTLQQLIKSDKEIISNIFWTQWQPNGRLLPQVWMFDEYEQYEKYTGEHLTKEQIMERHLEFIEVLKKPGVYQVGGLGACTLISKRAVKAGVSFKELRNLSFWGEDRHFCIRAEALGFDLYVDTHYPAFHIYRESDLDDVEDYIKQTNKDISKEEKYSVISTTIDGIERLGTTGRDDWNNYFSEETLKVIYSTIEVKSDVELKIKAEVCDVQIKGFYNHQKYVDVEFLLINTNLENNEVIDKLYCTAQLIKNNKKWLINKFEVIDNRKPAHVAAKQKYGEVQVKKNILLVYTNYSGSNTVALYKNMPNELKEQFNIELIKQSNSSNFYEKLISSDIVIITEGNYPFNKKDYNPNQLVIDLWHGFPLKAMGYQDNTDLLIDRIGETWVNVDYIISYSELFDEKMNACIKTDINKYIITGVPRNDLLFNNKGKEYLSNIFGKDFNKKKCIFYMPTFRISLMKKVNEGDRNWNNIFDFNEFDHIKFLNFLDNENIELILKLHPAEERILQETLKKFNNINILSSEILEQYDIELYDVLNGADLLITDYSGVYFDYLLLNKPIIFTPTDLEAYSKKRGLLFDYNLITPGPKVLTQQELQDEIKKGISDLNYFEKERSKLRDIVHFYKDNNSSKRVWEFISKFKN